MVLSKDFVSPCVTDNYIYLSNDHIEVQPDFCNWQGFRVTHYKGKKQFRFIALPFGIGPTGLAVKPLLIWWKSIGIGCLLCTDDGLTAGYSEQKLIVTSWKK